MTRKKPVAVLVFGILSLVFGGLGLVCNLCTGVGYVGIYVGIQALYQQAPAEAQKELEEVGRTFVDNVPGLIPFAITQVVAGMVLAILQLVSGIGLVGIRGWGRWLLALWAVLEIIVVAGSLFYQLAVVSPGMEKASKGFEKWIEKQEQRQANKGQPPMARQKFGTFGGTGNPVVDLALSSFMPAILLLYAGATFIVMILPSTGRAIAAYHGNPEGMARDREEDLYDEDYLRRRRDVEKPPNGADPPGY